MWNNVFIYALVLFFLVSGIIYFSLSIFFEYRHLLQEKRLIRFFGKLKSLDVIILVISFLPLLAIILVWFYLPEFIFELPNLGNETVMFSENMTSSEILRVKGYLSFKDWDLAPENFRNLLWGVSAVTAVLLTAIGIPISALRTVAERHRVHAQEEHNVLLEQKYLDEKKQANQTHLLDIQREQNDRFVKAVELLGSVDEIKLQTRIGAIYSLENLGKESINHFNSIIDVLATFIRDGRANSKFLNSIPKFNFNWDANNRNSFLDEHENKNVLRNILPPPEDIIAALRVLSKLNGEKSENKIFDKMKKHLDLRNINLINLEIDFENFNFLIFLTLD